MQDFDNSTSAKATNATQTKSAALWMSRLRRLVTRGFLWTISQIKQTSAVTWQHFRSLLSYGVALWELRSVRKAADVARLDVGKELHRLKQGDENLRNQVDHLDNQIKKLNIDNKSTKKLAREKNNMFIQLASRSESKIDNPPIQQADAAVEQHTLKLTERRKDLWSLTRQHKIHTVVGYTAVILFLYLSASVMGGVIFPDDISDETQQVALVDETDDNFPTSDRPQPVPGNQQDNLPQDSEEADSQNDDLISKGFTRITQKEKSPTTPRNPFIETGADKTTSPGGIPSGFGTKSDPRLLTPDPTNKRSGVQVSVRKTYVVSGIGGVVMAGLDQALDGIRGAQKIKAEFNRQIFAARQRFWKEFPNRPGFAQAEEDLARLLFEKDLFMLVLYMPTGPYSLQSKVLNRTMGDWDGGIRPIGNASFNNWVVAIREKLGAKNHSGKNPDMVLPWNLGKLPAAIRTTAKLYDIYKMKRDWWEFWSSGHEADFYPTEKDYMLFVIRMHGYGAESGHDNDSLMTLEQAQQTYQKFAATIGEQRLLLVAEKLHKTKKTERATIHNAKQFGRGLSALPTEVFNRLIGETDLYGHALYLYTSEKSGFSWTRWKEAREALDHWFAIFGKEPVMAAVEQVRKAPRLIQGRRRGKWKGAHFVVEIIPGTEYTSRYIDVEKSGLADVSPWISLRALVRKLKMINPELGKKFLPTEKPLPKGTIIARYGVSKELHNNYSMRSRGRYCYGSKLLIENRKKEFELLLFDRASGKLQATLNPDFGEHNPSARWHNFPIPRAFAFSDELAIMGQPIWPLLKKFNSSRNLGNTQVFAVGTVVVFDLKTNQIIQQMFPPQLLPFTLFGSHVDLDGETALVCAGTCDGIHSKREAVYLFNARSGKFLHKLTSPQPDTDDLFGTYAVIEGNRVVVRAIHRKKGNDRLVAYVYDVQSGKLLHTVDCTSSQNPQKYIEFSAIRLSGDLALVGSVSFDLKTGKRLAELPIPSDKIGAIDLQDNIAVVGSGDTVQIFDVRSGKKLADIISESEDQRDFGSQRISLEGDFCWIGHYRADISHLRTK